MQGTCSLVSLTQMCFEFCEFRKNGRRAGGITQGGAGAEPPRNGRAYLASDWQSEIARITGPYSVTLSRFFAYFGGTFAMLSLLRRLFRDFPPTSEALSRFLACFGGTFAIFCESRWHFRDCLQSSVALSRVLAKCIGTFAIFSKVPWHFRDF